MKITLYKTKVYLFAAASLLVLIGIPNLRAQTRKIDSLSTLLKTDKPDTSKVTHLNLLTWELSSQNPDTAMLLCQEALALSQKIDWPFGIGASYHMIGLMYYFKGDYLLSLDRYTKALNKWDTLAKAVQPDRINYVLLKMSKTIGNIGNIYSEQGNYPMALEYYFKALRIDEKLQRKNGITSNLGNIGLVYCYQREYPKALEYLFKALKMDEESGNKDGVARHLGNIGLAYNQQKNFKKALEYYEKVLKMNEALGNKYNIANLLGNIGSVYADMGDFQKALEYSFRALKLSDELGDKSRVAIWLGNIGSDYAALKKYKEAEKYLLQALEIDTAIGSLLNCRYRYEALSDLYVQLGDYKKGYSYYKLYSSVKDSLFNEEKEKEITRHEMSFEFEKKEATIKAEQDKKDALAEEKNRKQKLVTWLIAAGLFLVIIFSGFIFRSLRITREQKKTIDEKNKHITDSITYAKHIQKSLLPSTSEINRILPYESFLFFQPKDIVSGDFYWIAPVEKAGVRRYVVVAADCTGHGVPGAFLSMIGTMILNEIVNEKEITDPSEILAELDKQILHALHRENESNHFQDGMDISICTIDPANNTVLYAGANNPVYFIRSKKDSLLESIQADSISLGDTAHRKDGASIPSFTTHSIAIEKGMRVYLSSDGYMDQFNKKLKKRIGSVQFKKLLADSSSLSLHDQKTLLENKFHEWRGDNKQTDDVLIIGIQF